MSQSKIQKRLNELGYCCPYAYFLVRRSLSVPEMQEELGLARRTIRGYRAALIANTCTCKGYCTSSVSNPGST